MIKQRKTIPFPHHTDHEREPRTIDAIRARANSELTNVVAGIITLKELDNKITELCLTKLPDYMVILIERDPTVKEYNSAIYVPKRPYSG